MDILKPAWLERTALRGHYMQLCLTEAEVLACAKALKVEVDDKAFPCHKHGFHVTLENKSVRSCVSMIYVNIEWCLDQADAEMVLVHEAIHARQALFKTMGVRVIDDEIEAYTTECLYSTLRNELHRRVDFTTPKPSLKRKVKKIKEQK